MSILIAAIIVILFISFLPQLIACRKMRMTYAKTSVVSADSPDDLSKKIISAGVVELKPLGFETCYIRKVSLPEINGDHSAFEAVMQATLQDKTVFAVLRPTYLPSKNTDVVTLDFISFFKDKEYWTSQNLPVQRLVFDERAKFNEYSVSPKELLQKHLEVIKDEKISAIELTSKNPEELEERWNSTFNSCFQALLDNRHLKQTQSGYVWTLRGLIKPIRLLRANLKISKKSKQPYFPKSEEIFNTDEAYARYIGNLQYLESLPTYFSRAELFGLFLLSALLAGVSFQLFSDHFATAIIILLVILIHEAGHALGMYLFGYKNIKLFFMPFFGGFASGKPPENAPRGEFLMLLLGPMPGLIISCFIFLHGTASETSYLMQYATISFSINIFNLLPVEPLDGGRMMNLILFNRFPRFQVGFTAFSGLLLCLSMHPLLLGIGIALLASLDVQWNGAKIIRKIKHANRELSLKESCEIALTILQGTSLQKKPLHSRINSVKHIINRTKQVNIGISHAVVFILLYLGSAVVLPGAIVSHSLSAEAERESQVPYYSQQELVALGLAYTDEQGNRILGDIPMG